MNKNMSLCRFCGSALELNSKFCHNCGAAVENTVIDNGPAVRIISERPIHDYPEIDTTPLGVQYSSTTSSSMNQVSGYKPPTYNRNPTYRSTYNKKPDATLGALSLVFAILSIIGIFPFIGSILAIILGGKKGGSLGIAGRTIGILTLLFGFLLIPIFLL